MTPDDVAAGVQVEGEAVGIVLEGEATGLATEGAFGGTTGFRVWWAPPAQVPCVS